jgi:hypothetical protein
MARNLPVADLGRVTDFVDGLKDARDKEAANTRKAVVDALVIWGGLKAWETYRANKKRRR